MCQTLSYNLTYQILQQVKSNYQNFSPKVILALVSFLCLFQKPLKEMNRVIYNLKIHIPPGSLYNQFPIHYQRSNYLKLYRPLVSLYRPLLTDCKHLSDRTFKINLIKFLFHKDYQIFQNYQLDFHKYY
jgi:hypothetical protein